MLWGENGGLTQDLEVEIFQIIHMNSKDNLYTVSKKARAREQGAPD